MDGAAAATLEIPKGTSYTLRLNDVYLINFRRKKYRDPTERIRNQGAERGPCPRI